MQPQVMITGKAKHHNCAVLASCVSLGEAEEFFNYMLAAADGKLSGVDSV